MKYISIELNKEFDTKDQLFDALKANASDIISIKKKQIVKSCDKGSSVNSRPLDPSKITESLKAITIDDDHYYIVVNTTKILDSHADLHLDKIWNRSAKEQTGKNYLVDTHVISMGTTLVKAIDIEIFVAKIPFSAIGKNYAGYTEALIYKFRKDKVIDAKSKEWLESKDPIEASVRMQYIDLVLCINSERKEDKAEKKNFDKYYPLIANKDEFEEEIYYFWAIKEAKNVSESSLVLFGSNPTTGQLIEAASGTSKTIEPPKGTPLQLTDFLNILNS